MSFNIANAAQSFSRDARKSADPMYWAVLNTVVESHVPGTFPEGCDVVKTRDPKAVLEYASAIVDQKYSTAASCFAAHQLAALIKKYPFPKSPYDQRARALDKFMKAERLCRRTNLRMSLLERKFRVLNGDLDRMSDWIRYVIGSSPNLEAIFDGCRFGPGAAIGVHGQATNDMRKLLADRWSVSPGAFYYSFAAFRRNRHMVGVLLPDQCGFLEGLPGVEAKAFASKVLLVDYDKIEFVPKDAMIFRTMGIPPLLNGFLQLGIGDHLNLKLKRVGIDLTRQDLNQERAKLGSYDEGDTWCTIDLSSASDCISIGLVKRLLPEDWYAVLDACRSHLYSLDNVVRRFEKFCAMGNGFCFPLETLIFAAVCVAAGAGKPGKDFLVYGDDIIVRRSVFDRVVALLHDCGFRTNAKKTFSSGPFRESCGGDYFGGEDVRPFTLDFPLDTIEGYFKFLNLTNSGRRSLFFAEVRELLLKQIPEALRLYRPYKGDPDTGIDAVCDEHLSCPTTRYHKSGVWSWLELKHVPVVDKFHHRFDEGVTAAVTVFGALRGASSAAPFTFRRKTRAKVARVYSKGAASTWLPPGGTLPAFGSCTLYAHTAAIRYRRDNPDSYAGPQA